MKRIALALLGATLLSPAALAQSSTTPSTSNSSSTMTTTSAAPSGQFMEQAQAGQWRASKMVGVDIYGPNDEKIGDVNEVMIDQQGNAKAVVIGVGGFLGIGQKNVAVPFDAVQWTDQPIASRTSSTTSPAGTGSTMNTGSANTGASTTTTTTTTTRSTVHDYPDHGKVSWTKDQLKDAPSFRYASDMNRPTTTTAPATGGATSGSGSTNR